MELLIDKYAELIERNWLSYYQIWIIDNRTPVLNISINHTDIKWYIHVDPVWHGWDYVEPNDNQYDLLQTGNLWVLHFNIEEWEKADPFFNKIVGIIKAMVKLDHSIRVEREEKEKEIRRVQLEEERKKAEDKICMDEYQKLMGIKPTTEFNKHFAILWEIESLWKEQLDLIKTWQGNNSMIESKRKEFYKLIS